MNAAVYNSGITAAKQQLGNGCTMVAAATAQRGTQGTTRLLTAHLSGPEPNGICHRARTQGLLLCCCGVVVVAEDDADVN